MTPVEEIKSKLDIVEVVGNYITLTQTGGNFKARCPFHNEKTPSFMVSREKQIWHCFGCDRGGDIIGFVMEHEGLDFPGALRQLAEKAGVALKGFSPKKENNARFYQINESAADFYHKNLTNKKVLDYLAERKISQNSINQWMLGLSGEGWDELYKFLQGKGHNDKDIFDAGLIVRKKDNSGYVDRFRKRLMFPIWDTQGRVVAFTSRTLNHIAYEEEDFGGKYINSPQTLIYDKSQTLYGWHFAKGDIRQKKYLIIVEGNMDAIASHQAGTKNTVAVSGTALTAQHLRLIKRYTTNLILSFDGDAAGSRATFRSVALAWKEDMNIKVLVLPKGKDPADMVRENPEGWYEAIKKAEPVMDYYVRRVLSSIDLGRADHKKLAVRKLLPILKYIQSKVEQAHYLKLISDRLQIPINILEEDLAKSTSVLEQPQTAPPVAEKSQSKDQMHGLSEGLLSVAFHQKEYLERLIDAIEPENISTDLQSLYRKAVIHYTKHQNLSGFLNQADLTENEKEEYSRLSLLISSVQPDITQVQLDKDFSDLLQRLKAIQINQQKSELIRQLREAESVGNQADQDQIVHKINILNKELHKLQN